MCKRQGELAKGECKGGDDPHAKGRGNFAKGKRTSCYLTGTTVEMKFSKCVNNFGLAKHTSGVFKIIEKGVGHSSSPLYSAQDVKL